jgi:hypothetical protein
MNSAIVVGGNGLIGKELSRLLVLLGVPTLVIGTSEIIHEDLENLLDDGLDYLQVNPEDINIEETANRIKARPTFTEGAVMFFLAWRGAKSLTDGPLLAQLMNVSTSCNYIKIAKQVFAKKFISTGSFEELLIERRTKGNKWCTIAACTDFNWYGISKATARRQAAFEAYVQKIDFCHTYISVVIDKALRSQKFIEQSLRAIYESSGIPIVKNQELCNIASSEEIARQLISVGEKGVNKSIFTRNWQKYVPFCISQSIQSNMSQRLPAVRAFKKTERSDIPYSV